jgi:hypothetical protein
MLDACHQPTQFEEGVVFKKRMHVTATSSNASNVCTGDQDCTERRDPGKILEPLEDFAPITKGPPFESESITEVARSCRVDSETFLEF